MFGSLYPGNARIALVDHMECWSHDIGSASEESHTKQGLQGDNFIFAGLIEALSAIYGDKYASMMAAMFHFWAKILRYWQRTLL